jgi:hypothetical protein
LPFADDDAAAFGKDDSLGAREIRGFGAVLTRPAPSRAYASPGGIAAPGARLATGLPGSALAERVSHPLDDFSELWTIQPVRCSR